MSDKTEYAPGTFCWADAGTTDVDAAKRFYGEVLGWSFHDSPMGEGQFYSHAQIRGKDVAALYEQKAEMRAMGMPPFWLLYISVKSVEEVTSRVEKLGGKVMMPPFDVMDAGRMAIIGDPTGAGVALWEPKRHPGSTVVDEPGTACWHELVTNDTVKAAAFFTELLGWEAAEQEMGPMKYTLFKSGGQPIGGMMAIGPEMGPMPPAWLIYFAVDDCDAAVHRAMRGGGKMLMPAMDIPTVGRIATLQDPQGAVFAIGKLEAPAS